MKISKAKLRQIIKEEISQVSEGFIEDPFDDGDGMINRLLGLRWGKDAQQQRVHERDPQPYSK